MSSSDVVPMTSAAKLANAADDPAPLSAEPVGGAGESRGPIVAPMSRETRAAFWRGYEVAIEACILIITKRHQQTGREMVQQMRDLMISEVPRAAP